jgi:hypothetical protein
MSTIITNQQNLNKIHWRVGDRCTVSKAQALIWAGGDLSKIHFYFFDNEWQDKNWSCPPTKSLETLIYERCQTLRGQTNHLSLWLSSGYDSVTILNRFALHNIPLDELVIYTRHDQDPEVPIALELAKQFQQHHQPRVKIKILNFDVVRLESMYQTEGENHILLPGLQVKFRKPLPVVGDQYSDDTAKQFTDRSDKINIWGFEKPRVDLRDGKWYHQFPDSTISCSPLYGNTLTGFWCDSDAFDLYHATCWSAIKWFESLPDCNHDLVHTAQSNSSVYYSQWSIASGRDPVYNSYSQYGVGKKRFVNGLGSPDSEFIENYHKTHNTKIYQQFVNGIKHLQQVLNHVWTDYRDPMPENKITVNSQPHFIKDFSPIISPSTVVNG